MMIQSWKGFQYMRCTIQIIINMRVLSRFLIFILLITCQFCSKGTLNKKQLEKFHDALITIDSHTDTPLRFDMADFDFSEYHDPAITGSKIDLPRMKEGKLDAVFLAVFLGQGERTEEGHKQAVIDANRKFDSIYAVAERFNDKIGVATSARELTQNIEKNKCSFFIGIENGYAIGYNLDMIDTFYNRGARYITLCHSSNNDICDSSTDTLEHGGLSAFGVEVVKRMNKLGMMIDVSHISDNSFYDVIRLSEKPVIASHSGARALCDHPRNLDDDMIRAIAKNRGVVQVCMVNSYVATPQPNPQRDSARKAVREKHGDFYKLSNDKKQEFLKDLYAVDRIYPGQLADVSAFVDHLDHIIEIAGIDYVGIGTDFDGGGGLEDCYDVSQIINVTKELISRGYTKNDIQKIWGENLMRVMKEVGSGS